MNSDIKITSDPINIDHCFRRLQDISCGGINLFIGTVRNNTRGREVIRLEFECYQAMALKEMEKIRDQAFAKWPVTRILIHHREGILLPGEIPVVTGAAAAHRDASFECCRFLIDSLKRTVPIWKKEVYNDGSQWVSPTP